MSPNMLKKMVKSLALANVTVLVVTCCAKCPRGQGHKALAKLRIKIYCILEQRRWEFYPEGITSYQINPQLILNIINIINHQMDTL